VIIPSYNHELFVQEAIESVLHQTFQDFEIIITDDCSPDKTVENIKRIKDPRIKLYVHKKNKGAVLASLNCYNHSRGEFISVLSSDDVFLPDKLEKQVNFLDNNKHIGAVFGHAQIIDEHGNDFKNKDHFYSNVFHQSNRTRFQWLNYFFYKANCLCHPTILIRRSCYEKTGFYDPRFTQLPDFDFWIRLCMNYQIHILQENLIKFRVLENGKNVSGHRDDVHIRDNWEHEKILQRYLRICTIKDLLKIFPEMKKKEYFNSDVSLIPFYISMLALEQDSSIHVRFGLDTLFHLLERRNFSSRLQKSSLFTYQDLMKLSSKDKYSQHIVTVIPSLVRQYNDAFSQLNDAQGAIVEREKHIDALDKHNLHIEAVLSEKDNQIESLDTTIRKAESVLAERDMHIAMLNSRIRDLEISLAKKDAEIKLLNTLMPTEKILSIMEHELEPIKSVIDANRWAARRKTLRDLLVSRMRSLVYCILSPQYRKILFSKLFDSQAYLKDYPDVYLSGMDPIMHYIKFGAREGRKAGPLFDTHFYLEQNPDVADSGINPLIHYIEYGIKEGRKSIKD